MKLWVLRLMMLITYQTVLSQQERRILEETVTPLTPRSSALPSPSRGKASSSSEPQDSIVRSLADWERKQEFLDRQSVNGWLHSPRCMCSSRIPSGGDSWLELLEPGGVVIGCWDKCFLFVIGCHRGAAQRRRNGNRGKTTELVTSAPQTTAWKQAEGLWNISGSKRDIDGHPQKHKKGLNLHHVSLGRISLMGLHSLSLAPEFASLSVVPWQKFFILGPNIYSDQIMNWLGFVGQRSMRPKSYTNHADCIDLLCCWTEHVCKFFVCCFYLHQHTYFSLFRSNNLMSALWHQEREATVPFFTPSLWLIETRLISLIIHESCLKW